MTNKRNILKSIGIFIEKAATGIAFTVLIVIVSSQPILFPLLIMLIANKSSSESLPDA